MKIQVADADTTLEDVSNLPEVAEPNAPTCGNCGKSFAEPREGETCIVCLTKEGKAPPSLAEQARAEIAAIRADPFDTDRVSENTAAMVREENSRAIPTRPSLDVAIETHGNLMPRISALCDRLLAWDVASLDAIGSAFSASVSDMRTAFVAVGVQLKMLAGMGFVAKTSAKSRRDRAIAENKVALSDATRSAWSKHYSEEELSRVSIVAIEGELVWVNIGNRTNPMPVPLKRTQLVPA